MATKIRKRFKPESEAHLAKRVKESIALRLSDPHAFFKRLYESGVAVARRIMTLKLPSCEIYNKTHWSVKW